METEYIVGVDVGSPAGDQTVVVAVPQSAPFEVGKFFSLEFYCATCKRITHHLSGGDEDDDPILLDTNCVVCGQRVLIQGTLQARVRALRRRSGGK